MTTTEFTQLKLAVIRAPECIGCGRCLDACPVDAIIGSKQWLHQVLSTECIGCKLCVAPCPVDCIDLIEYTINKPEKIARAQQAKNRYLAKQQRQITAQAKLAALPAPTTAADLDLNKQNIKAEIRAALLRKQQKLRSQSPQHA